jgi:hypothetical protein
MKSLNSYSWIQGVLTFNLPFQLQLASVLFKEQVFLQIVFKAVFLRFSRTKKNHYLFYKVRKNLFQTYFLVIIPQFPFQLFILHDCFIIVNAFYYLILFKMRSPVFNNQFVISNIKKNKSFVEAPAYFLLYKFYIAYRPV